MCGLECTIKWFTVIITIESMSFSYLQLEILKFHEHIIALTYLKWKKNEIKHNTQDLTVDQMSFIMKLKRCDFYDIWR